MTWDQISRTWRIALVSKLQDRYGLAEEEAVQKADAWLRWIGEQPSEPVKRSRSRRKLSPSEK